MIHIALDKRDLALIHQCLRDRQFMMIESLARSRKDKFIKEELEHIKSLLTRLHVDEIPVKSS